MKPSPAEEDEHLPWVTHTVYRRGMSLKVHESVMERLGLRDGQEVTEAQAWACIELHCAAFAAYLRLYNLTAKKPVDPTGLEQKLASINAKRRKRK